MSENRINVLPFDCWLNVTSFNRSGVDFLALVYVVKGFWEYVKEIGANATRNAYFNVRSFPKNPKPYISKIMCGNMYLGSLTKYMKSIGCPERNDIEESNDSRLFSRIVETFPNLQYLRLHLSWEKNDDTDIKNLIFSANEEYTKSMTDLTVFTGGEMNFKLDQKLPKLKNLYVFHHDRSSMEETRQDSHLEKISVNWSKLPESLREVNLQEWQENEGIPILEGLKNKKLEILALENMKLSQSSISKSEHVEVEWLSLTNMWICDRVTNLDRFKNLKKLSILETLEFYDNRPPPIRKDVADLYDLEEISIEVIGFEDMDGRRNDIVMFSNLPKLKKAEFRSVSFPVFFVNTPRIEIIESRESSMIELKNFSDGLELKTISGGTYGGENLKRHMKRLERKGKCGNNNCGRKAEKICRGCKLIYYCSFECSKKHWKIHKRECKK